MTNQTFQKWCVFVLFLTAALWITGSLLEYLAIQFGTDTALIGQALRFGWAVLLVFGLLAIYHFDIERASKMGFFAFVTAMTGTILKVIPEYLLLSSLTGLNNAAIELETASPIRLIATLIYVLGYMWFGVAIFHNGSFSKWGAVLYTLGSIIGAIPGLAHDVPIFLSPLGALSGGAGLIWLGLSLLHKKLPQVS